MIAQAAPLIPPPTFLESLLFVVLATLSGILVGALFGAYLTRSGLPGDDGPEDRAVQRGRIGFAIMVGVITELLLEVRRTNAHDWHTWAYLGGALFAVSGYGQLAVHGLRRRMQARKIRRAGGARDGKS